MPRIADLEVEFVRAESDKYAAPLLLLHGLWTEPRLWRAAASYWSHRGWNCWAPAWRSDGASWSDALARLQRVAAELPRPIAIGHDLGALLALSLEGTSAAVGIAPLAHGASALPHPLSRSLRARVARWRSSPFVPSAGEAQSFLGLDGGALKPESSGWWTALSSIEVPSRGRSPRLVVAGESDPLLPAEALAPYAASLGAELLRYAGAGHDLPYGPRWQAAVADVHRWIVRRLGSDLLLLRGDEDLVDE